MGIAASPEMPAEEARRTLSNVFLDFALLLFRLSSKVGIDYRLATQRPYG